MSRRSDLDAGEAGNGRSNTPIVVVMEMATEATAITTDIAGATLFEPIERNENSKRSRRSVAPLAPSDWKSRMERTIKQYAHELLSCAEQLDISQTMRKPGQPARRHSGWQ